MVASTWRMLVAEDSAAPRTAGRGRWSACSDVPGWAGVSWWNPPGISLASSPWPTFGLPVSYTSLAVGAAQQVVVARLEPFQSGVVLAGEADQVGRQVGARHLPPLVPVLPDAGQVHRRDRSATAMSTPRARYSNRDQPPPGRFFFAISWHQLGRRHAQQRGQLQRGAGGSCTSSGSA